MVHLMAHLFVYVLLIYKQNYCRKNTINNETNISIYKHRTIKTSKYQFLLIDRAAIIILNIYFSHISLSLNHIVLEDWNDFLSI